MKPLILIAAICIFLQQANAQDQPDNATKEPDKWEERYREIKDSLALLYPTLPAVASVLIKEKQVEVNFYNALISGNEFRDNDGNLNEYLFRQTYLFSTLQVHYGISKKDRLNVGLAVQSVVGRIDQDRNSSIFKIFSSKSHAGSLHEGAITSISPRVRWRPFANNYRFTVQSSISIPTGISSDKQNILGKNQFFWLNQFIYNYPVSDRFFLLSQLSMQYGFKTDKTPSVLNTPVSVYLSYFIPRKTALFTLLNYVPVWMKGNNRHTLQAGAGLQYQLTRQVLVNGYYANDLLGKNYPDLATYMIGLRIVSR